MTNKNLTIGLGAACAVLLATVSVQAGKVPPAATKKGVTYAGDIKAIFEKHKCFDCHGPDKQKGKLRLDSLEAVKKGAGGDAVATVGKSESSTLIVTTSRVDEDEAMPPEGKGEPLTAAEVGLIRAWIDQGMK